MRKNHSLTSIGMEDDYQSASLWEIFSRQIGSFIGIFIVFAVGAAAAALASWNFADPSLNNYAAETRPTNILGFWGASFADISMQFFGLGSVAALLPPFFWGLLLIAQKNIPRLKRRLGFLLLGLFTLSAACALLPPPQSWPMPIGLGGVVGDKLVGLFNFLPGAVSPFFISLAALFVLFPLAMIFAAYAGGVILRPHGRRQAEVSRYGQENNEEETAPFYPGNDNNIRAAGQDSFAEDNEKPEKHERWHSFFGFILHHYLRLVSFCRLHFGSRDANGNSRVKQHFSTAGGDRRREPYIDTAGAAEHSALVRQQKISEEEAKTRQDRFFTALDTPAKSVESRQKPFILPSINYLAVPKKLPHNEAKIHKVLQKNAQNLSNVLEDFGVKGDIAQAYPGPVVTLYELEPAPGVKSSRIISLSDDIARSMSASSARIAVMNGRNALGIELPNQRREKVYLREILESKDYRDSKAGLALALGQSIGGDTVIADLARMPHLLVAGTTGSGKSVAINTMILSL
ncbi:DNA translocase FtsK 4TM domain-containing protein, partial [Candidatus Tokpelaia sp.]|uniref:DNA translocase FtsK 4TM domain-containing protein n=1 Tax=Candidatus Tokpelaia sp. TaxID=2233777 RepID=UPI00123A66F2